MSSQTFSYEIIKTLNILSISIPTNIQQKTIIALGKLQKNATVFAETLSRFEAKEFVQIARTFSQIQHLMQPFIKLYPQLNKFSQTIQNSSISTITLPTPVSITKIEDEIYKATETLVEKALEHGVTQDELSDETVVDEVIFIIAYYTTTLTHNELFYWVKVLSELILTQIKAAGDLVISGILNILAILEISQFLCDYLRSILP